MRKVKRLTNEVANLNKEVAKMKQVGLVSLATAGGLFLVDCVTSTIINKRTRNELEDLRDTLLVLGDTVTDHLSNDRDDFEDDDEDDEDEDDITSVDGEDESPPHPHSSIIIEDEEDDLTTSEPADMDDEDDVSIEEIDECSLVKDVFSDIVNNEEEETSKASKKPSIPKRNSSKKIFFNNVEETENLKNLLEDLSKLDLSDNKISKSLLRVMIDRHYKTEVVSFTHCEPSYMIDKYIYGDDDGLSFILIFDNSKILISISDTTIYCSSI